MHWYIMEQKATGKPLATRSTMQHLSEILALQSQHDTGASMAVFLNTTSLGLAYNHDKPTIPELV